MRKAIYLVLLSVVVFACGNKNEGGLPYSDLTLETFKDKISYAIGADMVVQMNNLPDTIFNILDKAEMEKGYVFGFNDVTEDDRTGCRDKMKAVFVGPDQVDTTVHSIQEVSHCYGMMLGEMTKSSLKDNGGLNQFDIEMARKGFAHGLYKIDTLIALEERGKMIIDFNNDLVKKVGKAKMEESKSIANAQIINEDVVLVTEEEGNGEPILAEKEYKMYYVIQNAVNDTLMATLIDPSQPDAFNSMEIRYNDLVEGWREASSKMQIGGKYALYVASPKAYGEEGVPNGYSGGYIIKPFEMLKLTSRVISQNEVGALAKERGEKVMAAAVNKTKAKKYPEGYVIETIKAGEGENIAPGSDVQAHYVLTDSEGNMLENSYQSAMQNGGQAPAFNLNGVVKGWTLGLPKMRVGGTYKLYLPYDLAYGESGNGRIKPFETLTFELEILATGAAGTLVKPRPQMQGF